ncbi:MULTISPECIES: hypothetical protein [Halorubrum]|uniref:hypothetical protein n=1 Tax=Halorubrum TaxID=56688 RepID=UPI0006775E3B|nr:MULTISPECIES: hypothetical protein [Halorubrum]
MSTSSPKASAATAVPVTRSRRSASTRQSAALDFYEDREYERTATSTAGAYELVHFEKDL